MFRERGDEMIVTEFRTKTEYTALNHTAYCTFYVATKLIIWLTDVSPQLNTISVSVRV